MVFAARDRHGNLEGLTQEQAQTLRDDIAKAVANKSKPAILPNILLQRHEDKAFLIVKILKGSDAPYHLKSQGVAEGTYLRFEGQTLQALPHETEELKLTGQNRLWERQPGPEAIAAAQVKEDLALLNACAQSLDREDPGPKPLFKLQDLLELGLLKKESGGYRPALGYLLLCGRLKPAPKICCRIFQGTDQESLLCKQELEGPLYLQIRQACAFAKQALKGDEALLGPVEEAVAQAAIQRSYLSPSDLSIEIFSDRLQLTIPGMLGSTILPSELKDGRLPLRQLGLLNLFGAMKTVRKPGRLVPYLIEESQRLGLIAPSFCPERGDLMICFYRSCGIKGGDTNQSGAEFKNDTIVQACQAAAGTKAETIDAIPCEDDSIHAGAGTNQSGTEPNNDTIVQARQAATGTKAETIDTIPGLDDTIHAGGETNQGGAESKNDTIVEARQAAAGTKAETIDTIPRKDDTNDTKTDRQEWVQIAA